MDPSGRTQVYTQFRLRHISEVETEVFVHHQSKSLLSSVALLMWASGGTVALAAQDTGNAPQEQTININLDPGMACVFGVNIFAQGKAKTITLPGGRTVITSPGLHATVTNLDDPSKQLKNVSVTGSSHTMTRPDGSTVVVFTGRNLNFDPVAGFVIAIGRFSIVFDSNGNLMQPLKGNGQLIDVCATIE